MTRLFMLLLPIIMTSLAGIGVVVVLTMGLYDWRSILMAAGAGAVLALPITWFVARQVRGA
ncbi:hypothetical protein [Paracoccus jeotgali]|uniref:CTP synthetase n=1 Tax=Paracoccus jeotgali TaxID=2065379 RepID=A0A2K9MCZ3_9RHOB|nr:hypothetical protein [Paracoccus jeotgali]AUM73507.1 hypothetical protein CYR75_03670 [Paracoccus jeotgali]